MVKKKVLVIGVTSGLGREAVRQLFATGGYEIHGTHSGRGMVDPWLATMLASVTVLDLEDAHALDALKKGHLFQGERFDEVMYFIGVASAGYPALSLGERDRVLRINHVLTMQVLRAVINNYLQPRARLTVASSAAAWWGLTYAPGYCLSKARLNESLDELCREGVAVTCWTPGAIATELWQTPGIPTSLQTVIGWLAPSPLWAVRDLLTKRLRTSSDPNRAVQVFTTADAWLSYHVPGVSWLINQVLSAWVELDGRRAG